jgi:hypothetical protein
MISRRFLALSVCLCAWLAAPSVLGFTQGAGVGVGVGAGVGVGVGVADTDTDTGR